MSLLEGGGRRGVGSYLGSYPGEEGGGGRRGGPYSEEGTKERGAVDLKKRSEEGGKNIQVMELIKVNAAVI